MITMQKDDQANFNISSMDGFSRTQAVTQVYRLSGCLMQKVNDIQMECRLD